MLEPLAPWPIYTQAKPSQSINLGSVPVNVSHVNGSLQVAVRVEVSFLPTQRLLFLAKAVDIGPTLGYRLFTSEGLKLTLADRDLTIDALCVRSDSADVTFVPNRLPITVTPPTDKMVRVTFHLFNFPEFLGKQDYRLQRRNGSRDRYGRMVLSADGWRVTIATTDKTKSLSEALGREGGFAITHTGHIEREDGSAFSTNQVKDLLQCLGYFLSFALGRWAGIALPVGLDRSGTKVFEEWGVPSSPPGAWVAGFSWFCPHHAEVLSEVFPGFMARWKNDLWRRTLQHCLYWYVSACGLGMGIVADVGLILAQTALELLAWTYCVHDRKMISAEAFDPGRLAAADRLRLLAAAFHLPLQIPSSMRGVRSTDKWRDSMDAIAGVRNRLVHPRGKEQVTQHQCHDTWRLSLWYLDMVLLHLFGHQGVYVNRLKKGGWVGETERVPWAQATVHNRPDLRRPGSPASQQDGPL